jgi:hypothetical protein
MDMRFGTWNVRGSLETVVSELVKYNLDLVAVQDVRWDKGGSQPANYSTFFYGNEADFFIHKKEISSLEGRIYYVLVIGHHI